MADGDDDFYEDDFYYEDDYLYVEDSYGAADELAETSVPSPPPYDRIDDDYSGYDVYDYWMDVEYGDDEYYDLNFQNPGVKADPQGRKRKIRDKNAEGRPSKLSKLEDPGVLPSPGTGIIWQGPNVVYMRARDMHNLEATHAPVAKHGKTYALLPDWRKRFPSINNKGSSATDAIADADLTREEDVDELLESEVRDEDDEEVDSGIQLDPTVLMSILQSKFGSIGGDGAEIQAMLGDMLASGEGDMDAMLEKLTKSVLEHVDEGGADSGIGQWLAQQGVSLPAAEHEENQQTSEDPDDSPTKTTPNGTTTRPAKRTDSGATTGTLDDTMLQREAVDLSKGNVPQPAHSTQLKDEKQDQPQSDNAAVRSGKKRKAGADTLVQPAKKQSRGHAAANDSSTSTTGADGPSMSAARPRRKRK